MKGGMKEVEESLTIPTSKAAETRATREMDSEKKYLRDEGQLSGSPGGHLRSPAREKRSNVRCQSDARLVRTSDHLLLRFEPIQRRDRPKRLILVDRTPLRLSQHGRLRPISLAPPHTRSTHLVEESRTIEPRSSDQDLRALALRILDMASDFVERSLVDQRSVSDAFARPFTDAERSNGVDELGGELVVHAVLDKDPVRTDAGKGRVRQCSEGQ